MTFSTRSLSVLCSLFILSGWVHASSLNSVAKRIAKGARKLPNRRIAVLPFVYPDGGISSGSSIVAERLTTLLVDRGVSVVERSLLDRVLGEMKLETTGMTDAASAQKLGKMLNADAVVTGSLDDLSDQETELNARLVRTETGEVLAASTITIDRTWKDAPQKPIPPAPPYDDSSTLHMSPLIPVQRGPGRGYAPPAPRARFEPLYNAADDR